MFGFHSTYLYALSSSSFFKDPRYLSISYSDCGYVKGYVFASLKICLNKSHISFLKSSLANHLSPLVSLGSLRFLIICLNFSILFSIKLFNFSLFDSSSEDKFNGTFCFDLK